MPRTADAAAHGFDLEILFEEGVLLALSRGRSSTVCGALSTAITPNSSVADNKSSTCTVPMLARSIFVLPPATGMLMEPERSSTTTIAVCSLRISLRRSMETGRSFQRRTVVAARGIGFSPPVTMSPAPVSSTRGQSFHTVLTDLAGHHIF